MKKTSILFVCMTALVVFAAWAPNAEALEAFGPDVTECMACHDAGPPPASFKPNSSSAAHRTHLDKGFGCGTCHAITGDTPATSKCAGCHEGVQGLATFHDDKGVELDPPNPISCATCHPGPPPSTEAICDDGRDNDDDGLVDCDDTDDCSTDPTCVVDLCADNVCDNGVFCDGVETCDMNTGECLPGTPPDCDDGVDCTDDPCDATADACVNTPNNAKCDDNDVCNGIETCDPVNDCLADTPLDCNDEIPCTDDSCDAVDGCANAPVQCNTGEQCNPGSGICRPIPGFCSSDADCDDEQFCTGVETCVGNTCRPGTPPDCNDNVECTADTCDEVNDTCTNAADDTACDDNDVCNGIETCDPVNDCQTGTPPNCNDGNLCTDDSCDAAAGCVNAPVQCSAGEQCNPENGICEPVTGFCATGADCDDGMFCTGVETCVGNTCRPGMPPDCDDNVECTVDTCDEINDTCANAADDTACDDNDVCNGIETCDPVNDCQAGTPPDCSDGNLCTDDSCDAVAGCVNDPVPCNAGEQCNPDNGICEPIADFCASDANCDDGMFCNGAETCVGNTCQPGTPPDCNDGVECTVDTCDEVNDTRANTPNITACPDDGLFCNGQEICDPDAGCVRTGDPCPAGSECNEDARTCDRVDGGEPVDAEVEVDEEAKRGKLEVEIEFDEVVKIETLLCGPEGGSIVSAMIKEVEFEHYETEVEAYIAISDDLCGNTTRVVCEGFLADNRQFMGTSDEVKIRCEGDDHEYDEHDERDGHDGHDESDDGWRAKLRRWLGERD